ncbi:laccase 1 [Desarmillaria tabescens]|uniref:Laccase 1 n=1 Tax=Armillaria tabescens TaxID=1929756 RepID=A0AA39NRC8_ARMTA|nr:laccase 1 [Desarmillaria tabescens]KAK0470418.1 laccase 1 [Desarmillaria tabescens]
MRHITDPDPRHDVAKTSHLSISNSRAEKGPFIIYDPNDPHADLHDVDDESTVLFLSYWYHSPAKQSKFPTPSATLINGLGRCNSTPSSDLSVISVVAGTWTIIEVDGVNHVPNTVHQIEVFAGIGTSPSAGSTGFTGGINSAIFRYSGASETEHETEMTVNVLPMNETDLVPLENPGAALNLAFSFTSGGRFNVNGANFTPPTMSVLLQILSGVQNANDLLPAGAMSSLPSNATIEISMSGGFAGGRASTDPFHLYRYVFDVDRTKPVRHDIVNTENKGDNVTTRFTTDNPGPRFLSLLGANGKHAVFGQIFDPVVFGNQKPPI